MRRIACLTDCAVAFFCVFLSAAAAMGRGPAAIGAAAGQSSTAAPSAPTAASGTAATQGKIYFCTNQVVLDQQNRKFKEFWSDAFASDAKQANLSSAWRVYLAATYQLNPNDGRQINGGCGDETTVQLTREWKANAKQRWERTTKIEQDRVAAGSPGIVEQHTVVDTGWKYTPDQAVAAAPAPATTPCSSKPAGGNIPCGVPATAPAPAALRPGDPCFFDPHGLATAPPAGCGPARVVSPTAAAAPVAPPQPAPAARAAATLGAAAAVAPVQIRYVICWGELKGPELTAYFSAPFAVAIRNNSAWSATYKEFLRKQYNFAGDIHCPQMNSLSEAQQSLKVEEQRYRARWKIVETGWEYK
jgi:hypothetical protein